MLNRYGKKTVLSLVPALALVLLGAAASANQAAELDVRTINGETGKPIENVNIFLVDPPRLEYSDKQGRHVFEVARPGIYRVYASHVAYLTSDTVRVSVGVDGARCDLRLDPRAWVLNEVVTTGTRSPHMLKDVPVQTEVVRCLGKGTKAPVLVGLQLSASGS